MPRSAMEPLPCTELPTLAINSVCGYYSGMGRTERFVTRVAGRLCTLRLASTRADVCNYWLSMAQMSTPGALAAQRLCTLLHKKTTVKVCIL